MDFSAMMQAGKDRAAEARHKGLPTGQHASWARVKAPDPEGWALEVAKAKAYWQAAKSEALAAFDWSSRLEWVLMEDGNAIPF